MKTFITAFPIDKTLQQKLSIYDNQYVKSVSVGRTVHALIEAGFMNINSFVELTGSGETRLTIHCTK
jgi:hypothetical protein